VDVIDKTAIVTAGEKDEGGGMKDKNRKNP